MTKREKIRSLFLNPKETYSGKEIQQLLEVSKRVILNQMTDMHGFWELQNLATKPGEIRLSRIDVFRLIRVFDLSWSPVEVEEALGSDLSTAIPEPLQLQRREIALPNAVWRAMEKAWKECRRRLSRKQHAPSFERWLSWQQDDMDAADDAVTPEDKAVIGNPEFFLGKDAPGRAALPRKAGEV